MIALTLSRIAEIVGGLDEITEAYRRVDSGRKRGNLVVLPNA